RRAPTAIGNFYTPIRSLVCLSLMHLPLCHLRHRHEYSQVRMLMDVLAQMWGIDTQRWRLASQGLIRSSPYPALQHRLGFSDFGRELVAAFGNVGSLLLRLYDIRRHSAAAGELCLHCARKDLVFTHQLVEQCGTLLQVIPIEPRYGGIAAH